MKITVVNCKYLHRKFIVFVAIIAFTSAYVSCKKFVELPPSDASLIRETVFENDATAVSAMAGIYYQMNRSGDFPGGGYRGISMLQGLTSDEFDLFSGNIGVLADLQPFYSNDLLGSTSEISGIWNNCYSIIYSANDLIEGLTSSVYITSAVKTQLEGEAKFLRAFCHFYLVNLFGDIPYVITTDYRVNSTVSRTPASEVYRLIIADLLEAQDLLKDSYPSSGRVRPNKWVAKALLSRVYLYTGDWAKAEVEATAIINNSTVYGLPSLDDVFLKNSIETIWQLFPATNANNSFYGDTFIVFTTPKWALVGNGLFNSFENGDLRKTKWVGSITNGSNTYNFPHKYRKLPSEPETEYSMVFRLAEQYLIRAEARAKLNNLEGAVNDLNAIRMRTSLLNLPTTLNQSQVFSAIEQERRIELFGEMGHRWFDLKRTGRVDAVIGSIKPTNWQSTDALLPIPEFEILRNKNLTQNPGY